MIHGIAKKNISTGQWVTKKDFKSVHDYTKKSLITIPRKIDLDYILILLIMFILGALTVIFITWIMAVLGGKV